MKNGKIAAGMAMAGSKVAAPRRVAPSSDAARLGGWLAAGAVMGLIAAALWALLAAHRLQGDLDRDQVLTVAETRLAAPLAAGRTAELGAVVGALMQTPSLGFRYLAVRDASGVVLSARGRYENLDRDSSLPAVLRPWLRELLYSRLAETGLRTLRSEGRTLGSLEYSVGSVTGQRVRDEAVDRLRWVGWAGLALAALLLAATFILGRQALLGATTLRELPGRLNPGGPAGNAGAPRPAPTQRPGVLQVLDELQLGAIDIDRELRIVAMNDSAARLTEWPLADAVGQLVYTVFHARDEAGAPVQSPAERCQREGQDQPLAELRLRPRGGQSNDRVVEARAQRLDATAGTVRMVFQDISGRVKAREGLRQQARLAEGVVDHLLEAVLTTDASGVVKSANARALRMFGYSVDEMQRMTIARLLPVPFMNTPGLKLTDYIPGAQQRLPKLAGWRKDATTFPAELVVEAMRAEEGERLVVIIRDITEQLRSQSLAQRLGRLLDAANEEVYIFDAQSLYFIEVNKGARKNLGLKPDQLSRMTMAGIAADLEMGLLQSYLAKLRGGEAEHITYKANHRRQDGSTYPVEVRLSFSRDEEPPVFMAIALDITEREAAEKRMRQLAHYDNLTGLPNRALLFDRLKQAMLVAARGGRQMALFFMDLDGFKPINDAYGHEAGDAVLRSIADRLNTGLRAADTVARFGGDEFVVLAHGIRDVEDAQTLANKIHELFRPPFDIKGNKVSVFASVGITLYPADNVEAEALLRHADAAMYEAKQRGRGRSEMHPLPELPSVPRAKPQRADLAREIHSGITMGRFQLLLLPVFGAQQAVVATVADFHWTHPDYGRVDSRETLTAAKRAGLNAEIESWLLSQVMTQISEAREHGLTSLPVLLPLTGRQWRDPEFAERISRWLEEHRIPAGMIIPVIDGADWSDAAEAVQLHWAALLRIGLRIALRRPALEDTMEGVALILTPWFQDGSMEEGVAVRLCESYVALGLPVIVENVASTGEWPRLAALGVAAACGSGLHTALSPMEFFGWVGSHPSRPL